MIGDVAPDNFMIGDSQVDRVMVGDTEVWSGTQPIEFVGSVSQGYAGTASAINVDISNIALEVDDVILIGFVLQYHQLRNMDIQNFTEITKLRSDDRYDTQMVMSYKISDGTETTIIIPGGTTDSSAGGAVVVMVYRNIDILSPFEVTTETAIGEGTCEPTPPSITPSTDTSILVTAGGGATEQTNGVFSTSGLDVFNEAFGYDNNPAILGVGHIVSSGTTYTPNKFSFSGTDDYQATWCGVTIVLKAK